MAVGADFNLRSPLAKPLASPKTQAPKSFSPQRQLMVNDNAVQSMQNNQLAAGAGTARAAMADLDRAGVSRGKGQQYAGDIAEAGAMADGNSAADKTGMMASLSNVNAQRNYEGNLKDEQLTYGGLLEGLRNSKSMERLSRMGNAQDIQEAIRRGQFGLDQIGLDYSPLLTRLFS
jgi:hypothetical protein